MDLSGRHVVLQILVDLQSKTFIKEGSYFTKEDIKYNIQQQNWTNWQTLEKKNG